MFRNTNPFRGHKASRTQYFIPFYTEGFFNKTEEGIKSAKTERVSFPVKVVQSDEETRTNTQQIKVNVIDFFDSNIERTLNVYAVIENRLVRPRKEEPGEAGQGSVGFTPGAGRGSGRPGQLCGSVREQGSTAGQRAGQGRAVCIYRPYYNIYPFSCVRESYFVFRRTCPDTPRRAQASRKRRESW